MDTGVDQGLPVVLPGTVRRCVRGPVSPSLASGRTTVLRHLRQRLRRYGFTEETLRNGGGRESDPPPIRSPQ
jgi:hypothetical protein